MSTPAEPALCSSCGAPLPAEALVEGVCPHCLLLGGAQAAAEAGGASDDDPTVVVDTPPAALPRATGPAPSSATASNQPEEPQVVGNYKLREKIGEGGFGIVYLAEQTAPLRRQVAFKLLKPGMDSAEVVARFEAERQALALMDHLNVASVYDGGCTDRGLPYFVMEFVRGEPLTAYCDRHKLSVHERLQLFIDICHAIQHAHQKGIIHRDLKPNNVIVTRQDDRPVPKVIDFGIAKAIGQELTEKTIYTAQGTMVGTPMYMSPEQTGARHLDVDTRSDIYSLGVMLYELLTGTTPIEPKALREAGFAGIERMILEEEAPRPSLRITTLGMKSTSVAVSRHTDSSSLKKTLRGDLDWIVLKALEKDRARRYETASGLAADIERYLTDRTVFARPPTAAYRLHKFARRYKGPLAAAAAIAAVLVAGIVGMTWAAINLARAKAVSDRERYFAEMNLANKAAPADGGLGRVHELTAHWRGHDLAAWEWHYLTALAKRDLMTFSGHTAPVKAVAWSPDGRHVASGGLDRALRIWDTETAEARHEFAPRESAIMLTSWAPAGGRVAALGLDGVVTVHDIATGKILREVRPLDERAVYTIAWSPGGKRLATGGDEHLAIWDTVTPAANPIREIEIPAGDVLWFLSWHSEDDTLTGVSPRQLWVWNPATGEVVDSRGHGMFPPQMMRTPRRNPGGDGGGHPVALNPDRRWLAFARGSAPNMPARIHDLSTGEQLRPPRRQGGKTFAVDWNPDGRRLASVGGSNTILLWDANNDDNVLVRGHQAEIWAVAWSPDGNRFATGSGDTTVKIWDAGVGEDHVTFSVPVDGTTNLLGHDSTVHATRISWSPDSTRLLTSGAAADGAVSIWNARTGKEETRVDKPGDRIAVAVWNPRDTAIAAVDRDGMIHIRDPGTGESRNSFRGHQGAFFVIAWDPSGKFLATAGRNGTVKIHGAETGDELHALRGHSASVTAVAWNPAGTHLASAGADETVRLWNTTSGEETLCFRGHTAPVFALAWKPDGTAIASCGRNRSVIIWEPMTGEELLTLRRLRSFFNSLSWSPDGRRLAGGTITELFIWDPVDGKEAFTLPAVSSDSTAAGAGPAFRPPGPGPGPGPGGKGRSDGGAQGSVSLVAWSPNGRRLAAVSADGTIRIYDATLSYERAESAAAR